MSDDINRLKFQIEDLRVFGDELRDIRDALKDVVAAVTPIDLPADPEGHVELRDHVFDVRKAYQEIGEIHREIYASVAVLVRKAKLP